MDPCERERKLLKDFAFAEPSMIRRVCGKDAEPIYWELLVSSKWAKLASAKAEDRPAAYEALTRTSWGDESVDLWIDTRSLTEAKAFFEREEEKKNLLHRAYVRFGHVFSALAEFDHLAPAVQEVLRLSAKDYREAYPYGSVLKEAAGSTPAVRVWATAVEAKPKPEGQGEG
jgi:hypothetical protein